MQGLRLSWRQECGAKRPCAHISSCEIIIAQASIASMISDTTTCVIASASLKVESELCEADD